MKDKRTQFSRPFVYAGDWTLRSQTRLKPHQPHWAFSTCSLSGKAGMQAAAHVTVPYFEFVSICFLDMEPNKPGPFVGMIIFQKGPSKYISHACTNYNSKEITNKYLWPKSSNEIEEVHRTQRKIHDLPQIYSLPSCFGGMLAAESNMSVEKRKGGKNSMHFCWGGKDNKSRILFWGTFTSTANLAQRKYRGVLTHDKLTCIYFPKNIAERGT